MIPASNATLIQTAERRSSLRRSSLALTLTMAGGITLLTGCVTTVEAPAAANRPADALRNSDLDALHRARAAGAAGAVTERVLTGVVPLGEIPYDEMTLPVASPDGTYLATQIGPAPAWDALLASDGATLEPATLVEIHRLPITPGEPATKVATVSEPVVLGRGATATGVYVESPRPNGERWIGLADWTTGSIDWLVSDAGMVNAFATPGPDGRIAFVRRPVRGPAFELVVREATGAEWSLPADDGEWLMPTWAGDEGRLYVLHNAGGALSAVCMTGTSAEAAATTRSTLQLAGGKADRGIAYQTLASHVVTSPSGSPWPRVYLFHPVSFRTVVWEPPAAPVALDRGSVAAASDDADPGYVLMTLGDELVRRHILQSRRRAAVATGTLVPRATTSAERPYVLLAPGDGVISVRGLTVMAAD
ncbi:MAG: hypothetical protein HKO59_16550 [Phycisphaerales bacterium]|nr:hypothetical protein [Phycisphaerae bacterium]NNM27561.1 hypothetical protein [Phycisphaerales bacterium]